MNIFKNQIKLIKLLGKGLKFTPTSKSKIPEIKRDMEDFTRKLKRLREFLIDEKDSNENSQDASESLVRSKGKLNPLKLK